MEFNRFSSDFASSLFIPAFFVSTFKILFLPFIFRSFSPTLFLLLVNFGEIQPQDGRISLGLKASWSKQLLYKIYERVLAIFFHQNQSLQTLPNGIDIVSREPVFRINLDLSILSVLCLAHSNGRLPSYLRPKSINSKRSLDKM